MSFIPPTKIEISVASKRHLLLGNVQTMPIRSTECPEHFNSKLISLDNALVSISIGHSINFDQSKMLFLYWRSLLWTLNEKKNRRCWCIAFLKFEGFSVLNEILVGLETKTKTTSSNTRKVHMIGNGTLFYSQFFIEVGQNKLFD